MKIHNMSRRPIPGPYRKILYIRCTPTTTKRREKRGEKFRFFFFFFSSFFFFFPADFSHVAAFSS